MLAVHNAISLYCPKTVIDFLEKEKRKFNTNTPCIAEKTDSDLRETTSDSSPTLENNKTASDSVTDSSESNTNNLKSFECEFLEASLIIPQLMDPASRRILFHFIEMKDSWFIHISEAGNSNSGGANSYSGSGGGPTVGVTDLHVGMPSNKNANSVFNSDSNASCVLGCDDGLGNSLASKLSNILGKPIHLSYNLVTVGSSGGSSCESASESNSSNMCLQIFLVSEIKRYIRLYEEERKKKNGNNI